MTFLSRLVTGSALLSLGILPAAHAAIDLVGQTSATLSWQAADGPVAGYYLIVSRNGGEPMVDGWSDDVTEAVEGAYGDTIVVQVAAFDANGVSGPLSSPSEAIRFVSSTTDDPTPQDEPDPDPPGDTGALPAPSPVDFDFTGDGLSDLLVRDLVSGELSLWTMQGSSVSGSAVLPSLPTPWTIVGEGDYDGSGTSDLLWQNPESGGLSLWLVEAGVVTGGGPLDTTGLDPADDWRVGASGDVDGDGSDDALLFSRHAGRLEIWSFDGGAVRDRTALDGLVGPFSVVAAIDADGDGRDEIVWRDERAGRLALWKVDAGAVISSSDLAGSVAGSRVAGTGDIDGDGRDDLLVHHGDSGDLDVWFLEDGQVADVMSLPAGRDTAWTALAGGDFDGNDQSDVVWIENASGRIELWLMVDQAAQPQPASQTLAEDVIVVRGGDAAGAEVRTRLCDGDFDDDGLVGAADFNRLRRCFGSSAEGACTETDMNSDGVVGQPDYELFRTHFGGEVCRDVF
jgi:hypothetical protein